MSIVAKDNRKEYTPAPEGLHQAVCIDVEDLGLQDTPWGQKQKVAIRWQLEESDHETDRRFQVMNWYTLSLHSKATLRQHLEAWRGRKFKAEELQDGFDLERLLGVNCQLQIVHSIADGGRTYANIQAIVPLGKGMKQIIVEEYVRVKDRDDSQTTPVKAEPANDDDLPF